MVPLEDFSLLGKAESTVAMSLHGVSLLVAVVAWLPDLQRILNVKSFEISG